MKIELPFPPASLSGHAKGNWHGKSSVTKKRREWARLATLAAGAVVLRATGDIAIRILFQPANRRGDRTNFAGRMKPYIDGIADALGLNDSRFLPSYEFAEPTPPGLVTVTISGAA